VQILFAAMELGKKSWLLALQMTDLEQYVQDEATE
jgi:hypothetical protein